MKQLMLIIQPHQLDELSSYVFLLGVKYQRNLSKKEEI